MTKMIMAKKKYDDIHRVYDLYEYTGRKENKKIKNSFIRRLFKVRETIPDVRSKITCNILNTLENIFGEKSQIAGIREEELLQTLNSRCPLLLISDKKSKTLASIDYTQGIRRIYTYYGTYDGSYVDCGTGIALTIFGDSIKTPEQFNLLQSRL